MGYVERGNLDLLSLLHPLCHRPQMGSGDFHCLEFTRYWVKNAFFDEIHLPGTARGAQRVAAGVAECGSLAGFCAGACHKVALG